MNKNKRIRTIILSVLTVFVCCVTPFLTIFLTGVLLPAQYTETWYGAFAPMYEKLTSAQGKKIIIVGNSNIPFGVDSALAEELLRAGGLDYTVCNFGLYGSLGTKMMAELALSEVDEGDIVILIPETAAQPMSTYFSAQEAWYALDGDMSAFFAFGGDEQGALAGAYAGYVSEKLKYADSGQPAQGSGVYASASFDANCDLKNYSRPQNAMPEGYDANNPVAFESSLVSPSFVLYVNDYAGRVARRGGQAWYSFCPVNELAVQGDAQAFYALLADSLDTPVISDIGDYIMEKEWFYDSNFHLNSSGMTVRTVQLVNDVKNQLGNTTKTECELPNKPAIPQEGVEGEGDNSCAQYFTYELNDGYYTVTGLTEEGKSQTELVLPYQVDGIYIDAFNADVFAGNTVIESITIQDNISVLSDGSFDGCTSLREIYLAHDDPADISVGYGLFNGTSAWCNVYVPESAVSLFTNNYFWGRYAERLRSY